MKRCLAQMGAVCHFYVFQPPRRLAEIDAKLKTVTDNIPKLIGGLTQ